MVVVLECFPKAAVRKWDHLQSQACGRADLVLGTGTVVKIRGLIPTEEDSRPRKDQDLRGDLVPLEEPFLGEEDIFTETGEEDVDMHLEDIFRMQTGDQVLRIEGVLDHRDVQDPRDVQNRPNVHL